MPQRTVTSPIGPIRLTSHDCMLQSLRINAESEPDQPGDDVMMAEAERQLGEYFDGRRVDFSLPLVPAKTPRGAALRAAIAAIGHGQSISYGALARRASSGARAIGQACAHNPLPIVVPCHRVVASNGLGHYSGGDGIVTKRWLLAHEATYG